MAININTARRSDSGRVIRPKNIGSKKCSHENIYSGISKAEAIETLKNAGIFTAGGKLKAKFR